VRFSIRLGINASSFLYHFSSYSKYYVALIIRARLQVRARRKRRPNHSKSRITCLSRDPMSRAL
jgi:hypothetical protein